MKKDGTTFKEEKEGVVARHSLAGFTVVELLVSIVLGLLLVAAATQLFMGGLVMARLQQGNAEAQDNGLFGLEYVIKDIRLANFNNITNPALNDTTIWGGIVLTAKTAASTATSLENLPVNLTTASAYIPSGLLSHSVASNEPVSAVTNQWQGLSNVAEKSDQLTIQFIAPTAMSNCEGVAVLPNDLVVQRYFLRADGVATGVANISNLALACDANTPSVGAGVPRPAIINGMGDAGAVIMPAVDHFHVMLVARRPTGNLSYFTINQYRAAALAARTPVAPATTGVEPPRIVAVKIAVLVRSLDNTRQKSVDPGKSFVMLDQTVTPNATSDINKNRFARQVYSTTVALRNGFGEAL